MEWDCSFDSTYVLCCTTLGYVEEFVRRINHWWRENNAISYGPYLWRHRHVGRFHRKTSRMAAAPGPIALHDCNCVQYNLKRWVIDVIWQQPTHWDKGERVIHVCKQKIEETPSMLAIHVPKSPLKWRKTRAEASWSISTIDKSVTVFFNWKTINWKRLLCATFCSLLSGGYDWRRFLIRLIQNKRNLDNFDLRLFRCQCRMSTSMACMDKLLIQTRFSLEYIHNVAVVSTLKSTS